MRMHPVISTLLAAWFGLGSTLGPRFLCACADGTVTVQLGHRFCCDTDDSCCDSCNGGDTSDEARGVAAVDTRACADGCESTPLSDEIIAPLERGTGSHSSTQSESVHPHYTRPGAPCWAVTARLKGAARAPNRPASEIHKLRSVILLV